MRISCLLIILCLLPKCSLSQNTGEKEKLTEKYYFKGLKFGNTQKDSSFFYYERALRYAKELENYSDAFEILFGMILTARKHGDIKNHQIFIQQVDSMANNEAVIRKLDDYPYYRNRSTYEKSTYFYNLMDYDRASQYFKQLYSLLSKKPLSKLDEFEYNLLIHTTNYLALIYSNNGKYDLAENYFNRSLAFIENNPIGESKTYRLATLQLLAQLCRLTKNYVKSDHILKETLNAYKILYDDDKGYKNNVNAAYIKLIENALDQKRFQEALATLKESQKYLLEEDPFNKTCLVLYGDAYTGLGENQKALESYQKALQIFKEYRQQRPHEDIAMVYGKITELYIIQKQYLEGLESLKKAFKNVGNDIEITNDHESPDPEKVFSKTQLLHLLDIKLQLLTGMYEKANEADYLDVAVSTDSDILETFDLLKNEFDSKLDKQFLAEKAYPIFRRMLAVAHTAYENDPSSETLQLALNIAEKNKDFVLLEALRNARATQYGNVPQKVLDKEAQLRAEITYIEKEIFDATETESGFSDDLIKLKQEYYNFLDTIKTNYPKYHDLKYQSTSLDLGTVRKWGLEANGTLVSYTMTDDYLYAIVLNRSKENFLKLPFSDTDRQSIRKFYRLLSRPSISDSQKAISDLGKSLYEKILKKPLKGFDTENLTIIPDGELLYLPFDLLQKNGSYVLNTINIGYGNSLTSLLELKNKKPADQNRLLAFAPMFDNVAVKKLPEQQTRQLGKLAYNDDEVNGIKALFDTDIFMAERATLTNFKMNAPLFNVIHLATHAFANDEYPDYSYLAFTETKDSAESNILYIKDLYNTTLNADLVTLSACQTGIGKLQKGRGMLSLSKGFYYAGAKSLVNTLWEINDKSTVKLMDYFYEGLSKGKSKTEALRDAKLKYLETTDDNLLRHPYYWAAFVVSGDVSAISKANYWWYLGLGSLLLATLFLLNLKRNRKRKAFDIMVNM